MAQYIDKDALLAELERRIKTNKECMLGLRNLDYYQGKVDALNDTISSINSLEAREVDYDKALTEYLNNFENASIGHRLSIRRTAKHFFELGLRASSSLTWEDMMIIHKCIKDAMNYHLYAFQSVEGQQKVYEEVLKRFKEQKGENI